MTTFTVAEDRRPRTVRRTWLDTFDWRLYRAGMTLQHVRASSTSELVLTAQDGQRLTSPASVASPVSPARWRPWPALFRPMRYETGSLR